MTFYDIFKQFKSEIVFLEKGEDPNRYLQIYNVLLEWFRPPKQLHWWNIPNFFHKSKYFKKLLKIYFFCSQNIFRNSESIWNNWKNIFRQNGSYIVFLSHGLFLWLWNFLFGDCSSMKKNFQFFFWKWFRIRTKFFKLTEFRKDIIFLVLQIKWHW